MQVQATGKHLRLSPRKARLIFHDLRGKTVEEALTILQFTPQPSAKDVAKVLSSAVANAENNYNLSPDSLHISAIYAGDGRTLKRYKPASRGRAHEIRRRTCHITVVVTDDEA